jgi:hypothetical protein
VRLVQWNGRVDSGLCPLLSCRGIFPQCSNHTSLIMFPRAVHDLSDVCVEHVPFPGTIFLTLLGLFLFNIWEFCSTEAFPSFPPTTSWIMGTLLFHPSILCVLSYYQTLYTSCVPLPLLTPGGGNHYLCNLPSPKYPELYCLTW